MAENSCLRCAGLRQGQRLLSRIRATMARRIFISRQRSCLKPAFPPRTDSLGSVSVKMKRESLHISTSSQRKRWARQSPPPSRDSRNFIRREVTSRPHSRRLQTGRQGGMSMCEVVDDFRWSVSAIMHGLRLVIGGCLWYLFPMITG